MQKLSSTRVGITQGSIVLFSDYQDGGAMWTGEGPRELRRAVVFSEAFREVPAVQVSLSMWDIDQKHNPRVDISADMITTEGFVIVFRTWGDTRVARVRADWLAIGGCAHEDDWEIS
ncbi:H-type lectin domain-containing protein [Rhodobacter aestuarii]|uniref:H-type lectin domain-containing protein n=1 Tax=Rhodobacter aestuarii TaxID=453582 RepID=A0A1N7MPF2_9RHOB|nr:MULTISPECIES: H-type lectin domain-containing protein [Rhodobacter]PTV96635.1 H-type lectin domain-containing protein [Rhodobacter aestuarii]SIS87811.1 H-type lectin domain-containing protein [Rhodobacter aestuarii]SOB91104.1 H-type lectin domain-containing protein [Rhodobacter sp. JA431]